MLRDALSSLDLTLPQPPIRASVWATMGEAETEEAWGETDECGDEEVSVHSDAS